MESLKLCYEFYLIYTISFVIYKKKFNIYFYPDYGFYPDISGFLSGADYPDKNQIIFLIYPDNGFYPDLNTT
jgi:hypothetical protein